MKTHYLLPSLALAFASGCSNPTITPPDASYQQKLEEFATDLTNRTNVPNITIYPAPATYPIGAVLDARFTGSIADKLNDCTIPATATQSLSIPPLPPVAGGNAFNFQLSLPRQLSKVIQAGISAGLVRQVSLGFDQLTERAPIRDPFEAAIKSPACESVINGRAVSIVAGAISGIEAYSVTATDNEKLQATLGSSPLFTISHEGGPAQSTTIAEKSPSVHFLILYTPTVGIIASQTPAANGRILPPTTVSAALRGEFARRLVPALR